MNRPNHMHACFTVFWAALFTAALAGCALSEAGALSGPDDARAPDARPLMELDGRIIVPVLDGAIPGDENPESSDAGPVDGGSDVVVTGASDAEVLDAALAHEDAASRDSGRALDAGPVLCKGYAPPELPADCEACWGKGCQANGCYGGYWCDTKTAGCHEYPPSGCGE